MASPLTQSLKRSWVQHTGLQLTTLTVLTATFTLVCFVLMFSISLTRILSHWGDSVQMTVYVKDDIDSSVMKDLEESLHKMDSFKSVTFVSRENATSSFKKQMSAYAPDLLEDQEFANPFPASFQLGLAAGVQTADDLEHLERLAKTIQNLKGVEDVSYGQSWVKNYSSFVRALKGFGWLLIVVLLAGSVFVIRNSVRSLVANRREEIELLELVGATHSMIRAPFVFEGAVMGLIASIAAVVFNYLLHFAEIKMMGESLAFARLSEYWGFIHPLWILAIIAAGVALGGVGALVVVSRHNTGWAASERSEA